jgi:hypothetical protein
MRITANDEVGPPARRYFSVVDEHGNRLPAVEYWAGSPDEDQPDYEIVPLRRFVKLLGAGESLREIGAGIFTAIGCGRRFVCAPSPDLQLGRVDAAHHAPVVGEGPARRWR